MQWRKLLDKVPSWEALRPVGRSRISRMTIAMPIVGYFILFNRELANALRLSENLIGISTDEASSLTNFNLYFLYFGLLIFSLANIAFSANCPIIIKQFEGEHEFCNRELEIISRYRFSRILGVLADKFDYRPDRALKETSDAVERIAEANNRNNRDFWVKSNSDLIMETLQINYDRHNHKKISWRIFVSGGYLVSFIIMAIPTVTTSAKILYKLTR